MKKLLFILLIFCSCNKDKNNPDNNNTSGSGSISYKVNGSLVTMDNANLLNGEGVVFAKQLKGTIIANTRYLLNAQKGVNNFFGFTITDDSLKLQSYHLDSSLIQGNALQNMSSMMFNGQMASIFYKGDVFDVKISSYSNSRISGTFSGKFTPLGSITGFGYDYANKGTILITEGKLNNIPVTY